MNGIRAAVRRFAFAAMILGVAMGAAADTVALKNGDRLTGTISDSDGKTLTLKTDYAGNVAVKWDAIQDVTSATPIAVTSADKKIVTGTIAPNGSSLDVRTAEGNTVSVPLANVVAVRSASGESAYQKSLHPSLRQDWDTSANIGFALARGNSETTNLTTGFTADRKTLHDQIAIYESSIYSKNDEVGGGVTANAILGGVRYDRDISGRLFGFGAGDFTHDELQQLTLRSIYTGGLGWHAIKRPNTTFDVLGGVNYTRETYSAPVETAEVQRNLPGITVGEDFIHKFGANTVLTEHFYFYPDLSDLSQYRMAFDANFVTKISRWFGWQVTASDRYVTNPPQPGTKSNDVVLSTGLNIALTHH